MSLSTRIEAGQPSRELFWQAWQLIHGTVEAAKAMSIDDFTAWDAKRRPFDRLLDAEAWTSAAEMLVPEGQFWHVYCKVTGRATAYLGTKVKHVRALTPATALLAAVVRSTEEKNDVE